MRRQQAARDEVNVAVARATEMSKAENAVSNNEQSNPGLLIKSFC